MTQEQDADMMNPVRSLGGIELWADHGEVVLFNPAGRGGDGEFGTLSPEQAEALAELLTRLAKQAKAQRP